MYRNDENIQQDVIDELAAEDTLQMSTIGVAVKDGVVHLVGTVPSDADRRNAVRACNRVADVRAVVDDLTFSGLREDVPE